MMRFTRLHVLLKPLTVLLQDSYRLPEGMVRTGYDADTGCYSFSDRTGTYTGLPGSQYGPMYPAGTETAPDRILVPVGAFARV
jgi:hypothetical protein